MICWHCDYIVLGWCCLSFHNWSSHNIEQVDINCCSKIAPLWRSSSNFSIPFVIIFELIMWIHEVFLFVHLQLLYVHDFWKLKLIICDAFMCDCFYCSFMIIFGITLHIHVSSSKLIDYDEEHKLRVPIIINLGQQRHMGLGFLLKLELGTTFGLHVEWSLCFPLVFFCSCFKFHPMKKLAL